MGWRVVGVVAPFVIIESGVPDTGLFVYNGKGKPGNPPVYSVVAPGVVKDPFGNSVTAVMEAGTDNGPHLLIDQDGNLFIFNGADKNVIQLIAGDGSIRVYPASGPAAQALAATVSPADGTTADGDQYAAGVAAYNWIAGTENGVRLFNGEFQFISYSTQWDIDASFYSSSTAIVNSLLPLSAEHPGSPGTQETWQTLGSPGLTNWASDHGRYRITTEGNLRIQCVLHATAAAASQASTYANSLPPAYQPAFAHVMTLGYNTNVVSADRWPRVVVTTTGPVNISLPALPNATQVGATMDIPLD
jgi:hypothetical protein